MKNNSFEWLKLDNAAKIFPGQNSRSWSNVFRIGIEMKEKIDADILKKALRRTLVRIPNYNVRIRRGFFWFYFEKNPNEAVVSPDIKNICYRINFKENKGFLFRIYYYDNKLAIDTYHAISDGYGATVFLSTVAAEYLRMKGNEISSNEFVLDLKEQPKATEYEDSYTKYATSEVKYNRRDKWVYHAVGSKMPMHICNYTVGTMSFEEIHKITKSYGVTVTEFFAALLLQIHMEKQRKEKKKQREVSVQIPVNLRKSFPSKTLRNFVLCLRVKLNPNHGEYTFEEILHSVSLQLRLANDSKEINSMMTQNMKIEKNPLARAVPLPIKNLGVSMTFFLTGEQTTSTLISNIGAVNLPEEMMPFIEKYMFFTGPGKLNGGRCGVITCGDKLVFTFSNCYSESDIEREFFTRIVKMGVHVKIESNRD